MAYIKVDHSKFSAASTAVDTYVSNLKKNMKKAENEVSDLASLWQGKDYTQFKMQWSKVTDNDSTYYEMIKALDNYSKFLKYAAEKYKDAQTQAINRADKLPKW